MKLRTDVLLRHDGKHVLCTGRGEICGPDEVSGDPTMLHDAMAAHAYKRELANLRKAAEETPRTHERQLVLNLLDVLDRRAAEILAGWLGEERG